MNTRLLASLFVAIEGWALQDFETCSEGDITLTPFTFIGEADVNGLSLEASIFTGRLST
jgi:hypothetical protein